MGSSYTLFRKLKAQVSKLESEAESLRRINNCYSVFILTKM